MEKEDFFSNMDPNVEVKLQMCACFKRTRYFGFMHVAAYHNFFDRPADAIVDEIWPHGEPGPYPSEAEYESYIDLMCDHLRYGMDSEIHRLVSPSFHFPTRCIIHGAILPYRKGNDG